MSVLALCLLAVVAAGLTGGALYAALRHGRRSGPLRRGHAAPVSDWPDVPIDRLGLFQRRGRIHDPGTAPAHHGPPRVSSLQEAQDAVLSRIPPSLKTLPDIGLRLSEGDPSWTDVLINGVVVAQIPTQVIAARGRDPGSANRAA